MSSPDHGVVCDSRRGICFDRFGPGIGITGIFLGPAAAQVLTAALRKAPSDEGSAAQFVLGEGIACRREQGPCRVDGQAHDALTAVLYGPRPMELRGAESPTVIGVDWQWRASRYANDSEARPADPARFRLRLEPDGSLRVRADCNQSGGRYRIDGGTIAINVTHSTMAACEPDSLDQAFRRDLDAAVIYFMRRGRLYIDLKHDTGTMEFARQGSPD